MSMRRNFDLPTGLFFKLLPILTKTDTESLRIPGSPALWAGGNGILAGGL